MTCEQQTQIYCASSKVLTWRFKMTSTLVHRTSETFADGLGHQLAHTWGTPRQIHRSFHTPGEDLQILHSSEGLRKCELWSEAQTEMLGTWMKAGDRQKCTACLCFIDEKVLTCFFTVVADPSNHMEKFDLANFWRARYCVPCACKRNYVPNLFMKFEDPTCCMRTSCGRLAFCFTFWIWYK